MRRTFNLRQLMFIVGTRAALAAGVAFLASERMSRRQRHKAGISLALFGAVTTIPAARILFKKETLRERLLGS